MPVPRMRMVAVDWIDSCASGGWDRFESYKERVLDPIRTVGFLHEKTRQHVRIIQNVGTSFVADSITIPRACVKRITTLAPKGARMAGVMKAKQTSGPAKVIRAGKKGK